MRRVYVRERTAYTAAEFAARFAMDDDRAIVCINALLGRGVLVYRTDKQNDAYDTYESGITGKYQFVWVGLAIFEDVIAVVYPKYFLSDPCDGDGRPNEDIKQIFQVLRKYGNGYSRLSSLSHDGHHDRDGLAIMLGLIESYGEHGLYVNYIKVLRNNGAGQIDWERTISDFQPFMSDGTPIYFDTKTIETSRDSADYVTRLHRCVLTLCSAFLHDIGIDELLELDPIELSEETLDSLGDTELVDYRLEQERASQFVTWKQDVLDMLRLYVDRGEAPLQPGETVCLGTSSFYHTWESACKVAFDDALGRRIDALDIELRGLWREEGYRTLLDIIPRPLWMHRDSAGKRLPCGDVDTLIPDIVCLKERSNGDSVFCIFDAKYYRPILGKRISGVPGVESITKQILYQSAYKQFIFDHGYDHVANAFIVPTANADICHIGDVSFPGVFDRVESPLCNGIQMWEMPGRLIFDSYLGERPISNETLEPLWESDDVS